MSEQKIKIDDVEYLTGTTAKYLQNKDKGIPNDGYVIKAFLPGLICKVKIKPKKKIKAGDTILVLEAMKMLNLITLKEDIIIKEVLVKEGDIVAKDQILVVYEPIVKKKKK